MPSLLRSHNGLSPSPDTLIARFKKLERAERYLIAAYEQKELEDVDRLRRQRILRWSILQHYEVCRTPLLDVTHSVRIAASFATGSAIDDGEVYVFVLGVPNLSGAITASAEAGLQIVRLASACPPSALRPHIQEGYLLGEYPDMAGYNNKENYTHYEIDFGRRLIAKFRFSPKTFWDKSVYFPVVEHEALYPDGDDPLFTLAQGVKKRLAA